MVEMALASTMLFMVLLGILDFGKAFNYWNDTNQIAAEGARYAAVDRVPAGGTLQSYLRSTGDTAELRDGTPVDPDDPDALRSVPSGLQVCVNYLDTDADGNAFDVGSTVEVAVSSQYSLLPFLGDELSPATITIRGRARMRLERAANEVTPGCEPAA
jgi:Flp pilus assembly protein TadG